MADVVHRKRVGEEAMRKENNFLLNGKQSVISL